MFVEIGKPYHQHPFDYPHHRLLSACGDSWYHPGVHHPDFYHHLPSWQHDPSVFEDAIPFEKVRTTAPIERNEKMVKTEDDSNVESCRVRIKTTKLTTETTTTNTKTKTTVQYLNNDDNNDEEEFLFEEDMRG